MVPKNKSKLTIAGHSDEQVKDIDPQEVATKEEILEGIRDGYLFVMSGGKGQPIDDMHREIAEELAREELAQNADIRP